MQLDAIVIGLGAMGSATLYELARRGAKVLGLERYGIPHDQGSSGGDTRLIRKAYYEHPDYVPLLERAYANWHALETTCSQQVLYKTGVLYIGQPEGEVLAGTIASARTHGLALDAVPPREVSRRWPMLRVPAGCDAWREPEGGFVLAGTSIRLFCEQALRHGAQVRAGEQVLDVHEHEGGVRVTTDVGHYEAQRVIVSAGSWTRALLPGLAVPMRVTRQTLFWTWPAVPERYALGAFTCWAAELEGCPGMLYGFPMLPATLGGQLGLKLALHAPGPEVLPDQVAPASANEFDGLRDALARIFAEPLGPVVGAKVCRYTSTPDSHFVLDRYQDSARVFVACGFSGHGFKFASVIGEVMADYALFGHSNLPTAFLRLRRFTQT